MIQTLRSLAEPIAVFVILAGVLAVAVRIPAGSGDPAAYYAPNDPGYFRQLYARYSPADEVSFAQ